MKNRIKPLLAIWIIVSFISVSVMASTIEPFTFAHITDTHIVTPASTGDYKAVLKVLQKMENPPGFNINTGDITSYGYPEEFSLYLSATQEAFPDVKIYNCSGNHDTRWSNTGKQNFRRLIDKSLFSFDYQGVHFVIMDSSMLLEQYAHFEAKDLAWLKNDLEAVQAGTPIILAFHHPPFQDTLFLDNEYEFLKTIESFNIPLILCGHTHSKDAWQINGITFVTADAVSQRCGFNLVSVSPDTITVDAGRATTDTITRLIQIPVQRMQKPRIEIARADKTTSYTVVVTAPAFESAEMSIDNHRTFIPLKSLNNGLFAEQIPYLDLPPGQHRIIIRLRSPELGEWRESSRFIIESGHTGILFSVPTGGAILSSPAACSQRVFFGSNDGYIYCVNPTDGKVLWKFETGAEVTAVPEAHYATVYIGSLDGTFYALSAHNGRPVWTYNVGSPVLASALVVDDKVFFGAGDFCMRALKRETGEPIWKFETGKLIKMRPAFDKGKLFFGSWDGYFYCVNAQDGGLVWKQQISDTMLYAPATSNPVIKNNKVIFVSHNYITHCLDTETGKEIWNYPSADVAKPSYSSGILYNDRILYGSITGHLDAFSINDGALLFATELKHGASPDLIFDSSPAIHGNSAIVGSVGGNLYGVNCLTGELSWRFSLQDGAIFSSPLSMDDIIFIGTNGGALYAIKTSLLEEQ